MKFSAKDGEDGGKSRCHGKNGEDIILKVPKGTVIYDDETGRCCGGIQVTESFCG